LNASAGDEGSVLFEELGFYYIGPVDGHDLDNLIPILQVESEPTCAFVAVFHDLLTLYLDLVLLKDFFVCAALMCQNRVLDPVTIFAL
jgi:hypothetical protein